MLAVSEPREGLPPCLSFAMHDGRGFSVRDRKACDGAHVGSSRFYITGGAVTPCGCTEGHRVHPEVKWHYAGPAIFDLSTDDPDEAQAAFDKGAEYVRTGVMP